MLCLGIGTSLGGVRRPGQLRFAVISLTVGFALFAVIAVGSSGRESPLPRGGQSAAATLRPLSSVIGYAFLLLGILGLTNVNFGGLVVGGAVSAVFSRRHSASPRQLLRPPCIAVRAALRTRSARHRSLRSALGLREGTIIDAGLVFATLLTAAGALHLAKAGLLGSAIGPALPGTSQPAVTPPAGQYE